MMLQQHIQLTDEELYCIRWHRGLMIKRIGTVTEGLAQIPRREWIEELCSQAVIEK